MIYYLCMPSYVLDYQPSFLCVVYETGYDSIVLNNYLTLVQWLLIITTLGVRIEMDLPFAEHLRSCTNGSYSKILGVYSLGPFCRPPGLG
jgi:hypothetical protein